MLCVSFWLCIFASFLRRLVYVPLHQTCQNLFVDSRCHGNSMTVASSLRSYRHWWGKCAKRCQRTCCLVTLWNNPILLVVTNHWHAVTFRNKSTVLSDLKLRQTSDRKLSKSCCLSFQCGRNLWGGRWHRVPRESRDRNRKKGGDIKASQIQPCII